MSTPQEEHINSLRQGLTAFGFSFVSECAPVQKLSGLERPIRIQRWQGEAGTFLLTNGCTAHTRNRNFKYEFIIHCDEPESYFADLISFTAYFHLTYRDVLPADLLEIGTSFKAVHDFSHIYVSVPYFLPKEINFIEIGELQYCLSWLMPVRRFEADFIQTNGVDAFEDKLERFGLDFFADRRDPSYLA